MKTEIDKYDPCKEAVDYRNSHPDFKSAWDNCPRGDWMLWIASRVGVDKRKLTLAKGKCAETVIHLMKDERSRVAVQAAIDYGNGTISADELRKADAASAAYASAYAAYAASTDAADAVKKENQQKTSDICREILTDDVIRLLTT